MYNVNILALNVCWSYWNTDLNISAYLNNLLAFRIYMYNIWNFKSEFFDQAFTKKSRFEKLLRRLVLYILLQMPMRWCSFVCFVILMFCKRLIGESRNTLCCKLLIFSIIIMVWRYIMPAWCKSVSVITFSVITFLCFSPNMLVG